MNPNQDSYYWLFSSSAQTISAFVAFLITGFALVIAIMDSLEQKDETFTEIHSKLKNDYYRMICVLVIITGLAIIMSLWMIFLNASNNSYKRSLFALTITLNLDSIIMGILFILSIINPNRYKKAAKELIEEDKKEFTITGKKVDQLNFITEFINLETRIREVLQKRNLYIPYGATPKMVYSFRQMIMALLENKLINRHQYTELLNINKYRNLVFHGHQDEVDEGMINQIKTAEKFIDDIF